MKTICITVKNAKLIQRYLLRSGLVKNLLADRSVRVIFLVPKSDAETYRQEFIGERVTVVGIPYVSPSLLTRASAWISRIGFCNRATVKHHFFKRAQLNKSHIKTIAIVLFGLIFMSSRLSYGLMQRLIRFLASRNTTPRFLSEFFERERPDLVFATTLVTAVAADFDIPILIEARRRGIKTAATVRGWSQLGPAAFLLFHPDHFILQNDFLKDMAVQYNFFPEERIRVVGFPYFDWFLRDEFIQPREEFLRSLGIDPSRRLIFYAGDGFPGRAVGVAELFQNLVKTGCMPPNITMLFRPEPYESGGCLEYEHLSKLRSTSVVVDKIPLIEIKRVSDPIKDKKDFVHLFNIFTHSDMLVTPGGTIIIEAAAFDIPIIATAFDAEKNIPYWLRAARYWDGTFSYWSDILKTGGVKVARSPAELVGAIENYLQHPMGDSEGRRRLREHFIEPFDGKATERLANELLTILGT